MLNENLKLEARELAESTKDMQIPVIIISPITTCDIDTWKKILGAFLDLNQSIHNKIGVPLSIAVIDGYDEMLPETLDAMGVEGLDDVAQEEKDAKDLSILD